MGFKYIVRKRKVYICSKGKRSSEDEDLMFVVKSFFTDVVRSRFKLDPGENEFYIRSRCFSYISFLASVRFISLEEGKKSYDDGDS